MYNMNKGNFSILIIILLLLSIWFNIYFLNKEVNHNSNTPTESVTSIATNNDLPPLPTELIETIWIDKISEVNIFEKTYNEFKKIQNFEDFKKWRDTYSQKTLLVTFVKMQDLASWEKYYAFLYDYYTEVEWWDFGEDFKNDTSFNRSSDPKENFILYMKEFYDSLNSGNKIVATKDNIENDLNLSFASNDFNELELLCDYREKNMDSSMDKNSCMDDNYLYRATKENKYCEKISDPYKVRLCTDFLNYQDK